MTDNYNFCKFLVKQHEHKTERDKIMTTAQQRSILTALEKELYQSHDNKILQCKSCLKTLTSGGYIYGLHPMFTDYKWAIVEEVNITLTLQAITQKGIVIGEPEFLDPFVSIRDSEEILNTGRFVEICCHGFDKDGVGEKYVESVFGMNVVKTHGDCQTRQSKVDIIAYRTSVVKY